ncbi:seroin-like [Maniola jurtina]|uniref:seroin-like n=1 Tax=Maniola jurtina TaxID=191418 RepID=UPI001E68E11A|nr:seroin-like [Maniola jurtina]
MSLTILYLIVGFIATTANAGYVWEDEDDSSKHHHDKFPHINFPDFPSFPQFTFPDFPEFPTIPPMEFPKPRKGFSGVSVSASSSAGIGKDGKERKSGGATVITSRDGVEKKMSVGDDPSNVMYMPFWQPNFPSFKMMDADTQKSDKPGKNEHFVSSSASSFSSASSKNGVSHLEGAANVYQNVNGKTDEQSVHVTDNDV